jgi:uncharacterized protein (DUF305 family)
MAEDIAELCSATDDFDLMFIDTLVAHYSSSILLTQEMINRAVHRELKSLGDGILAEQQAQVEQVLVWRNLWYPDVPIPDHHSDA